MIAISLWLLGALPVFAANPILISPQKIDQVETLSDRIKEIVLSHQGGNSVPEENQNHGLDPLFGLLSNETSEPEDSMADFWDAFNSLDFSSHPTVDEKLPIFLYTHFR